MYTQMSHPASGVGTGPESLADLRAWERKLTLSSLNEAIRLLESEKFSKLTYSHVRCIAEYQPIEIDGESFFEKAFSTGKEVAACLAYALEIGWARVLDDLGRLRLLFRGSPGAS